MRETDIQAWDQYAVGFWNISGFIAAGVLAFVVVLGVTGINFEKWFVFKRKKQ